MDRLRAAEIAHRAVHEFGALQKEAELIALLMFLQPPPRRVLEIGCDSGGTLYVWKEMGAEQVVGVTLPGGPYGHGYGQVLTPHGAEIILGNSHLLGTRELVEQRFPDGVDLLFIDGDHGEGGVSFDYANYSPLVRDGWIVFHDVLIHPRHPDVEVWKLWNRLPGDRFTIAAPTMDWGGLGVLRKGPLCERCVAPFEPLIEGLPEPLQSVGREVARMPAR